MAKQTIEEQQGRILPREAFDLSKFKITKKGVDTTEWIKGTKPEKVIHEGDYQPHPDLKATMDKLQLYMATRLGLLEGFDLIREHGKKLESLHKKALGGHDVVLKRMNINGIQMVGSGETRGVIITGSMEVPHYGSVGLAVPKINLEGTELGYESDVESIVEEITGEVYKYVHLNKKAQLDLTDPDNHVNGGDGDGDGVK